MNLQVLVSCMHQVDHSLLKKMNIQTDAIIINQCDSFNFEKSNYNNNQIYFYSFAERGVGLSRNNALMRATADICLFADEDVTYIDGYKNIVLQAFKDNPEADIILFNVPSTNPNRPTYIIKKNMRVRWYNCLRYGAVNIAVRTHKLKRANVYFSLLFGGGAKYSAGEDSLFLSECIRNGLKVYSVPTKIGYVNQKDSTWFNGYSNKYFLDKGAFYYFLSKRWAKLLCLQFVFRHRKKFAHEKSWIEALKLMLEGVKKVKGDKD